MWKPRTNPWLIAATVALAAFMEVLDTSIANVALQHIAGSLGASTDQATWVLTSYLVSNAIVLPLGAWASSVMGRKNFFLACIVIFTIASFLCGAALSLPMLLMFRVLQGAGGGGLQPMAQAIMADSFEPHKRGQAFALYGLVAVLAPSIGPTLGGWITDNYSLALDLLHQYSRSAFWRSFWSRGWWRIRRGSSPTARASSTWTSWA